MPTLRPRTRDAQGTPLRAGSAYRTRRLRVFDTGDRPCKYTASSPRFAVCKFNHLRPSRTCRVLVYAGVTLDQCSPVHTLSSQVTVDLEETAKNTPWCWLTVALLTHGHDNCTCTGLFLWLKALRSLAGQFQVHAAPCIFSSIIHVTPHYCAQLAAACPIGQLICLLIITWTCPLGPV